MRPQWNGSLQHVVPPPYSLLATTEASVLLRFASHPHSCHSLGVHGSSAVHLRPRVSILDCFALRRLLVPLALAAGSTRPVRLSSCSHSAFEPGRPCSASSG